MKALFFIFMLFGYGLIMAQDDPADWHKFEQLDDTVRFDYQEYLQQHPPQPFYIQQVYQSSFDNQNLYYIMVNEDLYPEIASNLMIYVQDVEQMGFNVDVYISLGGEPDDIRNHLVGGLSNHLKGVFFIGFFPVTYSDIGRISSEYYYTCDLFYMDLDGIWTWEYKSALNDSALIDHTGSVSPDIFLGRLYASSLTGEDEATYINNYLLRNHLYRSNQLATSLNDQALLFIDDDWGDGWSGIKQNVMKNFYQIDVVATDQYSTEDYTIRKYYSKPHRNVYLDDGYEFVEVAVHSNENYHHFKNFGEFEFEKVFQSDIEYSANNSLFFNLFSCRAGNYIVDDYIAGYYLFNLGGKTISLLASAKSGGILSSSKFHEEFGSGGSFGESFLKWFQLQGNDGFSTFEKEWFYGMTVLGDPLAHMRGYIYQDKAKDGFPVSTNADFNGHFLVDDLFNDGDSYILAPQSSEMNCFDKDGSLIWSGSANSKLGTPSIFHSGQTKSVVSLSKEGVLYAWDNDGNMVDWSPLQVFNENGPIAEIDAPVVSDLNGDGIEEIIVRAAQHEIVPGGGNSTNTTVENMMVYDVYGNFIWDSFQPSSSLFLPAVADIIDTNPGKEVVVLSSNGLQNYHQVLILDGADGSVIEIQYINGLSSTNPIIADVNNDNNYEILYGMSDGTVRLIDNSLSLGWSFMAAGSISSISANDIDHDGDIEIIFITSGNNKGDRNIYVLDNAGNQLLKYPINGHRKNEPLITNIDQDIEKEIICTTDKGNYIINFDGTEVFTGFLLDKSAESSFIADGDNSIDFFTARTDKMLSSFAFDGRYSLGDWATYRNDNQHTGLFKRSVFGSITENQVWENTIIVSGDVIISPTASLTIMPGTKIIFDKDDITNSGENSNLCEIIVQGELIANGTSNNKILFNSNESWHGIIVESYANVQLDYVIISNADYGLYYKPQLEFPWLNRDITNCEITNCNYGIYSINNNLSVSNTLINSNGYGIYALSGETNIGNCTVNANSTGIYLYDAKYEIRENSINENSLNGIYLSSSSGGGIIGNYMTLNSGSNIDPEGIRGAIFLYNSSPLILNNQINSNVKNGIVLVHDSYPVIQESNLIENNGSVSQENEPYWHKAEILFQDHCSSLLEWGHNDIVDLRINGGYLLMHGGIPKDHILVDGNYWGGESPEGRLFTDEIFKWEEWDEEPNTTVGMAAGEPEKQLYLEGITAEKSGDYSLAKQKYSDVVNQYPDSVETSYSLARILVCENELGGDIDQLKNYYSSLNQNISDPVNAKIAYDLSRRCEVKQSLFNDAIYGYEQIMVSNPAITDSIYAIIDIGEVYLLQNELSNNSALPKVSVKNLPEIPELFPENQINHDEKKRELFGLLFKSVKYLNKEILPEEFGLFQNYPNPFNPTTKIKYQLPFKSTVKLEIFDVLGQRVKTLVDQTKEAGNYEVIWDGMNESGSQSSSGIYFYKFAAKSMENKKMFSKNKKMLLIR